MLAALALVVGLALTGCQTGRPGVAAFVGGDEITVDEVQEIATGVAAVLPEEQVDSGLQQRVLNQLVVALLFDEVAEQRGIEITPSDLDAVRANPQFPQLPPELPDGFVEPLLRIYATADSIAQDEGPEAVNQAVLDAAASLEVEINPRYGKWNPEAGVIEPLISGGLAEPLFQATVPGEGPPVPTADETPLEAP